jgi:HEAT repeat protein
LTPGNVYNPWRTQDENLNLDAIVKNSWNLKDSSKIDDQLKYLKAQESLRSAGLQVDPDLNKTLSQWITDQAHHQKVRKAAAIFEWQVNRKPLNQVLEQLPKDIRDQLVDQIQQTNRLKDSLLQEANSLPDYASRIIDKFLRDKDPEVSRNAASALKSYQGPDAPALFKLALSDENTRVRDIATSTLKAYQGSDAPDLFKSLLSDTDPRVSQAARAALNQSVVRGDQTIEEFLNCSENL